MIGRGAAGAALAAGAAWSLPALAPVLPALAGAIGVERTTGSRRVALTFDDGPHPEGTPAVLERLDAAGVKATFFLVGEQVLSFPGLAARIVEEGHEVAIHGFRHRVQLRLTPSALAGDLTAAKAVIGEATGVAPTLHRPPLGIYSWPGLVEVRRRGWRPLLWSRWGRDWSSRSTPASIARLAGAGARPGDVILLHDADWYSDPGCWRNAVDALPALLGRLSISGLQVGPVGAG